MANHIALTFLNLKSYSSHHESFLFIQTGYCLWNLAESFFMLGLLSSLLFGLGWCFWKIRLHTWTLL